MYLKLETKGGLLKGSSRVVYQKKKKKKQVFLGSFSVTIKLNSDEEGIFWLTLVYSPNNSNLKKDFWMDLQDPFGLTYPKWCVVGILTS